MARKRKSPPTQKTRPRGKDAEGKPAKPETIPVPTRGEVLRDLKRLAEPSERPSQK
jgi:hypothetical protein